MAEYTPREQALLSGAAALLKDLGRLKAVNAQLVEALVESDRALGQVRQILGGGGYRATKDPTPDARRKARAALAVAKEAS